MEKFISQGRFFISLLLLVLLSIIMFNVSMVVKTQNNHKRDLIIVNDVQYGLLNVKTWVSSIGTILDKKIEQLDINASNRVHIKQALGETLDKLIVKINNDIREDNLKQGKDKKWYDIKKYEGDFKQKVTEALIDVKMFREKVPEYVDIIITYLNKPEVKQELRELVKEKIKELKDSTISNVDMKIYNETLQKYEVRDATEMNKFMKSEFKAQNIQLDNYLLWITVITIGVFFIVFIGNRDFNEYEMWLIISLLIFLLLGGLYSPMIELEAKISHLEFALFGEPLSFDNQVLFYENKSILSVISLLFATGKIKTILIGLAIGVFSIIFPIAKIISSVIYFFNSMNLQKNSFISWFALKSGKWSMADVMVIAIFIAYIGFNGVVDSQLEQLGDISEVKVLTTGGTELKLGFYIFTLFVVSSLFFSTFLDRKIKE